MDRYAHKSMTEMTITRMPRTNNSLDRDEYRRGATCCVRELSHVAMSIIFSGYDRLHDVTSDV